MERISPLLKKLFSASLAALLFVAAPCITRAQNLIANGDFETAPILGTGQSAVATGATKLIQTDPAGRLYSESISGIEHWNYATPNDEGTSSDHGLARRNSFFGLPDGGQSAFINNWNRMMSQTVSVSFRAGEKASVSIDFGTLGDENDGGRAGKFYLVAGETDSADRDAFSARSIVLRELSIANPTWTQFVPDQVVGNNQFVSLNLAYTFKPNDPALGLPLTLAFRTVTSSVGPTYWDNASLRVQTGAVPEPGTLALLLGAVPVMLLLRCR